MKKSKKYVLILVIIFMGFVFMAISILNIGSIEPKIIKLEKPIFFVGLSTQTTDKDIFKEVEKLGVRFNNIKDKNPLLNQKEPWAFVAVTKNYDPQIGTMDYLIGDVVNDLSEIPDGLTGFTIPPITYAVFPIKPKFKFLWGITIGRTKNYIYTKWLPKSAFELDGTIDDFEYHDDKSIGRNPEISLYVAIKEK